MSFVKLFALALQVSNWEGFQLWFSFSPLCDPEWIWILNQYWVFVRELTLQMPLRKMKDSMVLHQWTNLWDDRGYGLEGMGLMKDKDLDERQYGTPSVDKLWHDRGYGLEGMGSLDFQGMRAADSKGPPPPPTPPHFSQLHANESASG
ncbi:hypothetical protein CEXT_33301 [Caerostris extrusa]|uniref:Uncharacterized protein n=1 Tax=Caerostris extrusa TaxID=172846 RepID=A0AAV4T266_CAEEX|nr:hypothetical protein CEXT_33301 [Caerostris extrusa]